MAARILALETSTDWCSVALLDGETVIEREFLAQVSHSEHILDAVDGLIRQSGLPLGAFDGIAFGAGPGSFTGLRVACGVAQGLAFGLNLPIVPVESTWALARAAWQSAGKPPCPVVVALDARMQELYVAVYVLDDQMPGALGACLHRPVLLSLRDWAEWYARLSLACAVCVGSGFGLEGVHPGPSDILIPDTRPTAASVARLGAALLGLGGGIKAQDAAPVYVRDKVAFTSDERQARLAQGLAHGNPSAGERA